MVALYLAATYIPEFSVSDGIAAYLTAAAILTVINLIVKPILKVVLSPVIALTLGLFMIVINALVLYLLDLLSTAVTINGYLPLLLAALLVGAVNLILGFARKK